MAKISNRQDDARRDATKFNRFLLGIRRATEKLRRLQEDEESDLKTILLNILPDIAYAIHAEQAFAFLKKETNGRPSFEVVVSSLHQALVGYVFEPSLELLKLIEGGNSVLINYRVDPETRIQDIEIFDSSAYLVAPLIVEDYTFIVGAATKSLENHIPFLTAEKIVFDHIIELIQLGSKVSEKRRKLLQMIHDTGKTFNQPDIEIDTILQTLLEQAVEVTDAHFGSLQIVEDDVLTFRCVWPSGIKSSLIEKFGALPLDGKGITVRAVRENQAQLVSNIIYDNDYLESVEGTQSELAVVLRRDDVAIGVLNVEHTAVNGLHSTDKKALISLANLAVAALKIAQQSDYLLRAHRVALMGAWGAEIVHDINREVGNIRRELVILAQQTDVPTSVSEKLRELEQALDALIFDEPLQEMRKNVEGWTRDDCELDTVLHREITQLCKGQTFKLVFDLNCKDIRVSIHCQWLRRLIQHLINNAMRAIHEFSLDPRIVVRSAQVNNQIHFYIEDSGKGIRSEIQSHLFKLPITHVGYRSIEPPGRGLILVHYIVEQHGGKIWLDWTEQQKGARFGVSLPIAND